MRQSSFAKGTSLEAQCLTTHLLSCRGPAGDAAEIPGWGDKLSHASEQRSLCAATAEALTFWSPRATRKIPHDTTRDNSEGTVADKNTLAELASQQEYLTNVCYSRAYKMMKAKVEAAQELLQSIKKVLSHRCAELELTRFSS